VLVGPPTASDPRHATYRWRWRCLTSPQWPQLRHLYQFRRLHVVPRRQDCIALFLHALRQIRSIRRTVSKHVLLCLVVAMVLARLDYGSGTLAGLPDLYAWQASVCAQRCCTTGELWSWVRPRYATAPWFALVAVSGVHHVSSRFVWMCLHIGANMVWHRLIGQLIFTASQMLTPVGDFDQHRRQRCSFQTRLSTVSDRAFPVAAARAWNMGVGTYLRGTWAVPLLEVGRWECTFAVPHFGRRE